MSNKLFNNMLGIIIGDKNSSFDGHEKMIKKENDNYHHVMAYKKAINNLLNSGYDLTKFLENESRSEIIDLLKAGHILMLNVSQNEKKQGILYLPDELTKKQLLTFKEHIDEFKESEMIVLILKNDKLEDHTFFSETVKKRIK